MSAPGSGSSPLRRIAGRLALALAGTALFAVYATWPRFGLVPYACLVPWTILYTDPRRPRVSFIYFAIAAYAAWVLDHAAVFRWGWFAPLVMAAVFAPVWLPFPFLLRAAHRLSLPRAVTLPIVWVAVEWLRMTVSVGHFDIFLLGYSQAPHVRVAQVADLTGVYGLSFLVAMINGLLADAFFALRECAWRWGALRRDRTLVRSAAAVAGLVIACAVYGVIRLSTVHAEPGPRLAVIQPNIAHARGHSLGVTMTELAQTDAAVAPGSADLIVWPENAILDDLDRKGVYLPDLAYLATRKAAPILVGAQGYPPGQPDRTTNSAFLIDGDGAIRGRYDKQVLYPWTEQVPFDGLLGRLAPSLRDAQRSLVRRAWGSVSNGIPGTRMELFRLPWNGATLAFAALICVENSYPPLVAKAGREGARFFVNVTSEGAVGGVIQTQLLRVCMLRAIENRIAYVRCGNTGISGFIDPDGQLRSVLRGEHGGMIQVSGALTDRVTLREGGPTLYARSRDAFAGLCVAGAVGLALAGLLRGRRSAGVAPALALLVVVVAAASGCGRGRAFDAVCPDEAACRQALPGMADTFRRTDGAERGVVAFTRVADRFPALAPEALAYRAYFRDRAGDVLGAAADCEASLRGRPDARTWAILGSLRARMHDPRAALEAFVHADQLAPGDPEIQFLIARSHWEIGDLEEARRAVDDLLAKVPAHASALTLKGKLDLAAGRTDAAAASFQAAAAADPANLESRYYLARLAWRDGRDGEFKRWLEELKSIEAKLERPHG